MGRCIDEAVAEIDLRIEDVLAGLRRFDGDDGSHGDLRESLLRLSRDLEAVLAASGVELQLEPLPERAVPGNASLLRRILCRLLLGAGQWARSGPASVRIGLEAGGPATRIRLALHSRNGRCGDPSEIVDPALELSLGEGVAIHSQAPVAQDRCTLIVELPAGDSR